MDLPGSHGSTRVSWVYQDLMGLPESIRVSWVYQGLVEGEGRNTYRGDLYSDGEGRNIYTGDLDIE